MDKEEMRELKKQMEEYIKENKGYIEIALLIGEGESQCMPSIRIKGVSEIEVAKAIISLRKMIEMLEKEYPIAKLMTGMFETRTMLEKEDFKKGED